METTKVKICVDGGGNLPTAPRNKLPQVNKEYMQKEGWLLSKEYVEGGCTVLVFTKPSPQ